MYFWCTMIFKVWLNVRWVIVLPVCQWWAQCWRAEPQGRSWETWWSLPLSCSSLCPPASPPPDPRWGPWWSLPPLYYSLSPASPPPGPSWGTWWSLPPSCFSHSPASPSPSPSWGTWWSLPPRCTLSPSSSCQYPNTGTSLVSRSTWNVLFYLVLLFRKKLRRFI